MPHDWTTLLATEDSSVFEFISRIFLGFLTELQFTHIG